MTDKVSAQVLQYRTLVFNGSIPISVSVLPHEVAQLIDPALAAAHLQVPRMSYLPLMLDQILSQVFGPLLDEQEWPKRQDCWLEYRGVPLKWHWPIGLQFDYHVLGRNPDKPPTRLRDLLKDPDDLTQSAFIKETETQLPWHITLRLRDPPTDSLYMDNSVPRCRDSFMNYLKESEFVRWGSIKRIANLRKEQQDSLWQAIVDGDFETYWQVAGKLIPATSDVSTVNGRRSSPRTSPSPSLDFKQTETPRSVPIKVYLPDVASPLQDIIALTSDSGAPLSLKHAVAQIVPAFFPTGRGPLVRAIGHGILVPWDADLAWLGTCFKTSDSTADFVSAFHPEKPSARAVARSQGRHFTVSVAIPGSIVRNAQTSELRAWLAGQIARTCAIFNVNEVVVYNDNLPNMGDGGKGYQRGKFRDPEGTSNGPSFKDDDSPETFLARILEYLETPQYLRKALFPLHPALRLAGLLPPLDCPHHLRRDDDSPFREGVTINEPSADGAVHVDVGLNEPLNVSNGQAVPVNTRVTVRMGPRSTGTLVPPLTPTQESGLYWGYTIRTASSLANVFSESLYSKEGGYDMTIGTSERGQSIEDALPTLPSFRHALLVLGPLSGLELTVANDKDIPLEADSAADLFDFWLNVVEGQGSRTVRTEEALPIALARLKSRLEEQGAAHP